MNRELTQIPLWERTVARGFIPVGWRSRPKILGLLRSPAGINPLATVRSHRGSLVSSESEYTSLLPIGLIAFTAGCFSVDITFQNNKNRLSNEPESQSAA
jgi:hypothetical protein